MPRLIVLVLLTSAQANSQNSLVVSEIPGVVAEGTRVELVQEDFVFTEGPVGTPDGGLYFSDVRANRIYRLEPSGEIRVFLENTQAANGLALDESGRLLAAEGDGKRIVRINSAGEVKPAASETEQGEPFLSPNDLIADLRGGVYFTDPGPRPIVPGGKAYVYYLPPNTSRAVLVDDAIARPNGITLSGDGKTLFVADTIGDTVYAYSVQPDGSVKDKRPFASLRDIPEDSESGADGMVVDHMDRLYVATVTTGIQVFDKTGHYLGSIRVPRRSTNVAFSGPGKSTLYITAFEGLYRLQTLTQGADRVGK